MISIFCSNSVVAPANSHPVYNVFNYPKMKFYFLFTAFTLIQITTFAQESDQEKIKKVIADATVAWTQKTVSEWATEFWILDSFSMRDFTRSNGEVFHRNAEDLLKHTKRVVIFPAVVEKTEYHIHVNENMAFASLELIVVRTDTGTRYYGNEIIIMEKTEGVWKIHASSVHEFTR